MNTQLKWNNFKNANEKAYTTFLSFLKLKNRKRWINFTTVAMETGKLNTIECGGDIIEISNVTVDMVFISRKKPDSKSHWLVVITNWLLEKMATFLTTPTVAHCKNMSIIDSAVYFIPW